MQAECDHSDAGAFIRKQEGVLMSFVVINLKGVEVHNTLDILLMLKYDIHVPVQHHRGYKLIIRPANDVVSTSHFGRSRVEDLFLEHEGASFFDFNSDEVIRLEIFHVFFPLFGDLFVSLPFVWGFSGLTCHFFDRIIMSNSFYVFFSQLIRVLDLVVLVLNFSVLASGFIFSEALF